MFADAISFLFGLDQFWSSPDTIDGQTGLEYCCLNNRNLYVHVYGKQETANFKPNFKKCCD